ncbi:hypothetical protein Agub_g13039 [Astrephomene gubernaculifera]|uniref:G domain-containing protein n=1 Tax=Astrephomene gubernaculifera TaxID=47775 RepID=A0AAD3DZA3_9CHLO|nr:hypothetical protein Agub_g13039 [Astrephomene gubernaculifera]
MYIYSSGAIGLVQGGAESCSLRLAKGRLALRRSPCPLAAASASRSSRFGDNPDQRPTSAKFDASKSRGGPADGSRQPADRPPSSRDSAPSRSYESNDRRPRDYNTEPPPRILRPGSRRIEDRDFSSPERRDGHRHSGPRDRDDEPFRRGPETTRPFEGSNYSTGSPNNISRKRSEAERAARKAVRQADKVAEVTRNSQGCCYGCGAGLQTEVPLGAGYVDAARYSQLKQRRQLDKVLCGRCSGLCNGAMIPGVQDFTQKLQLRQVVVTGEAVAAAAAAATAAGAAAGATTVVATKTGGSATATEAATASEAAAAAAAAAPDSGSPATAAVPASTEAVDMTLLGKVLVTPEQLRAQLMPLSLRAAVVVLLVDLLDMSGSLPGRVREVVGRNPIVLVGTKMDLLPERCRPREVAEWLGEAAAAKRLSVVSVHLVSSHTGDGMSAAVSRICRERQSRDVFVVGAANVGKSAFVRAALKELAKTDPAAIGMGRYLPVESAMPGTTLGLIPLRAFSGGGTLFDTPGVHLHHRIPHMLTPAELKLLHPRRRLSVLVPPLPAELNAQGEAAAAAAAAVQPVSKSRGAAEAATGDASGEFLDEDEEDEEEKGGRAKSSGSSSRSSRVSAGSSPGGDGGGVRRGMDGIKIVEHAPLDEYGLPVAGLYGEDAEDEDDGSREADAPAATGSVRGTSPSAVKGNLKQQPPGQRRARATYVWSDLVRIDVLSGPPDTALVFYGPNALRVVGMPYVPPDQEPDVDYGVGSDNKQNVLICTASVEARGGLQPQELFVRAQGAGSGGATAVADLAVSGLPGWVAIWAPRAKQDVRLRVWAPRGVEVMLRPPLPCPLPPALKRAWRGEDRGGEGGEGREVKAPQALREWSKALSKEVGDPTADPSWWEALAAFKDEDAPGSNKAADGKSSGKRVAAQTQPEEEHEEDEDEEKEAAAGREWKEVTVADVLGGGDGADWDEEGEEEWEEDEGAGSSEAAGEGRRLMSATVEDILRRPRLDLLAQMGLDRDYDTRRGNADEYNEQGKAGSQDDDPGNFTLGDGPTGHHRQWAAAGPAEDGKWNPFEGLLSSGRAVGSSSSTAGIPASRVKSRQQQRMGVPAGKRAEPGSEQEEDEEEEGGDDVSGVDDDGDDKVVSVRGRRVGSVGGLSQRPGMARGRLGRRREVVRVDEEGEE